MYKFPSINSFYHVVKEAQRYIEFNQQFLPKILYHGTVKLHGTNCGISIHKDKIKYQSRNRLLDVSNDHYEFVKTMKEAGIEEQLQAFNLSQDSTWTFFGEWVGPSIQKNVAISQLSKKMFFIFSLLEINHINNIQIFHDVSQFFTEFNPNSVIHNLKCYPFPQYYVELDLNNPAQHEVFLEEITNNVDAVCPVALQFNITGPGEGIVWTPVQTNNYYEDTRWWFKTKGLTHKTNKEKKLVSVSPDQVRGIDEFVEKTLTQQRCQQAIEYMKENNIKQTIHHTGDFIKWIVQDIQKECNIIIEESGLEWKKISKTLSYKAKNWYHQYLRGNN